MDLSKTSVGLFIIGVGTAILSGFLQMDNNIKLMILVATGLFVGILNITEEQEIGFLIGGAAYILSVIGLTTLLRELIFFRTPLLILNNLVVFIASATVIVSLKILFDFTCQRETALTEKKREEPITFNHAWGFVVLVSVIATVLIVLLTFFFDISAYEEWVSLLDYTITFIFLIDLVILYKAADGFMDFLKKDWLDIVAVIPFWLIFQATLGLAFRLTKLARFVKVLRVLSKSTKATKIMKTPKTLKLWSNRSQMNKHVKRKRAKRPIEHLHARAIKKRKR